MAKYKVKIKNVGEHELPKLLASFGKWISAQQYPSVGYFDALKTEKIPREWSPKQVKRLQQHGFVFAQLPDGSLLALLTPPGAEHAAVVLLGSEGAAQAVASSFEEFLSLLSRGETSLSDLDDEEAEGLADGQKALRAFIKKQNVRAPKAAPFDFASYLGGPAAPSTPTVEAKPTKEIEALPPLARQVAMMMGRRSDDPQLLKFVEKTLGKKVPKSTSDDDSSAYVLAPKHGIELSFSHDNDLDAYPPIKNGRSFLPYLSTAWFKGKANAQAPFGLTMKMVDNGYGKDVMRLDEERATEALGKPTFISKRLGRKAPTWQRPLDASRNVWFRATWWDGPVIELSDGKKE